MTTTHFLDFAVEGWAGNFELEFVSYVFNAYEYDNERRNFTQHLSPEQRAETLEVLGEDFIEMFYGEYGESTAELEAMTLPTTGEEIGTIRVHVSDESWQGVDQARAVALLKARAESFFPILHANLASYQTKEGAFRGLFHTERVITETMEAL